MRKEISGRNGVFCGPARGTRDCAKNDGEAGSIRRRGRPPGFTEVTGYPELLASFTRYPPVMHVGNRWNPDGSPPKDGQFTSCRHLGRACAGPPTLMKKGVERTNKLHFEEVAQARSGKLGSPVPGSTPQPQLNEDQPCSNEKGQALPLAPKIASHWRASV